MDPSNETLVTYMMSYTERVKVIIYLECNRLTRRKQGIVGFASKKQRNIEITQCIP